MAEVVRCEGVTVVRGGAPILDDVSLVVNDNERWVVLGPNGAGKTTLLAVLSTLLFPTRGDAMILDELIGAVDIFELRPRIGFASSALAGQIPHGESVRDSVITAAYAVMGRWREQYEQADELRALALLESMGAEHLSDRTIGTLSEGERKRVLIARALMADPELLLLDEPAAGLDLGAREDLVARLGYLANDPTSPTLILVTHHVEEIPPGFTHALVLKDGHVVAAGPIEQSLTSAALTEAFGLPISVVAMSVPGGVRYTAHTSAGNL